MTLSMEWRPGLTLASTVGGGRKSSTVRDDAPLLAVLAKHDDRLLADAGLTREEASGVDTVFWREWLRQRAPWSL